MFQHHVFISYSHRDNTLIPEVEDGWVTRFENTLRCFLDEYLECESRIWRDRKLQGNENFKNSIYDACRDTTLFFSILTHNYVSSKWCRQEVDAFIQHAQQNHGLVFGNKLRLFMIMKKNVSRDSLKQLLPTPFHNCTGYQFYTDENQLFALDSIYGGREKEQYLRTLRLLSVDAVELIKQIEEFCAEGKRAEDLVGSNEDSANSYEVSLPNPTASKNSVVFLATCGSDQIVNRKQIEFDLRRHGYRVLPEHNLPSDDEDKHGQAVAALLEQAHCSLHLMGSVDSDVTNGLSPLSQAKLQLSMAAERHGLFRLIWLPHTSMSNRPNASEVLDNLPRQEEFPTNYDMLFGSFEELRTELHARLDQLEALPHLPPPLEETYKPVGTASPGQAERPATAAHMLYLLCTRDDTEATRPLYSWLNEQGWSVKLPTFSGDSASIRKNHESNLLACQAALIFYGAGNEAWHRSVVNNLRSAPAYRDGSPLPFLTYVAYPNSKSKDSFVEAEYNHLVDGRQGFRPELLLRFLQTLDIEAARP
jgi:hypothetical protein